MDRFWIIPIVALVSGSIIGVGAIEYEINTKWPNAAIERDGLKNLSCPEIMLKASLNKFWSPQNGKIGRGMSEICVDQLKTLTGDPYVLFCNPGGFAPDKKIGNSTHTFNHDICEWEIK